ncbi:MAG: tol-pal system protein YbgF [Hyphomicrobiales bacterium]|nr:tol-pal system protein YbgF [Hyphomicrobiales bacterium]
MTKFGAAFAALTLALAVAPHGAFAQTLPPAPVPGGLDPSAAGPYTADPSALVVRLQALEATVRDLRGQVETLQYENRKLKAALGAAGGAPVVAAAPSPAPLPAPAPLASPSPAPLAVAQGAPMDGDGPDGAFDPTKRPLAPGAPKPLGTPGTASAPLTAQALPSGPIELLPGGAPPEAPVAAPTVVAGMTPAPAPVPAQPASNLDAYGVALAAYRHGDDAAAERGFSDFLAANPHDRRVADATFLLGESYMRARRPRDAAERYLAIAKDYPASAKAPDALLRLGMALHALGNDPQACATLGEVANRYPQAAAAGARARAARERKLYRCGA